MLDTRTLWDALTPPPYGLEILGGAVAVVGLALWRRFRSLHRARSDRPRLGLLD